MTDDCPNLHLFVASVARKREIVEISNGHNGNNGSAKSGQALLKAGNPLVLWSNFENDTLSSLRRSLV